MTKFMKALVFSTLCLGPVYSFAANLPFVGTKYFNFAGGSGTEESIKISRNGHTVIMAHGVGGNFVEYSGKYKNPITLDNYPDIKYKIINKNKIALLDDKGRVEDTTPLYD